MSMALIFRLPNYNDQHPVHIGRGPPRLLRGHTGNNNLLLHHLAHLYLAPSRLDITYIAGFVRKA